MADGFSKEDFRGVIAPVVTTFDDDEEVNLDLFVREMHYFREVGVELVVVGAATGEGYTLTGEELASLVKVAVEDAALRVIAGVIATNTRDAISRGVSARSAGASALMVPPPIFMPASEAGLISYFEDISGATQLPIIVHNHFGVDGDFGLSPGTIRRLAEIPGVIGVKEESLDAVSELVQTAGEKLAIAVAADTVNLVGYVLGAKGAIAAINTVVPKESIEILAAFEQGDFTAAREALDRVAALARLMVKPANFPAQVKYAINLQGREVGRSRRPCVPLTRAEEQAVEAALHGVGALKAAVS